MTSRNKCSLLCEFFSHLLNGNIIVLVFVVISISNMVLGQDCKQISNCKCKFTNGSVIDLTNLGYQNEPRFMNVTPAADRNYSYYYNPCYPFSIGDCHNVAVCQVSATKKKEYQDCGDPTSAKFLWNSQGSSFNLSYIAESKLEVFTRSTNVTFICSSEAYTPKLEVIGEHITEKGHYEMRLTTRCACPDLCRSDHLSAGSVLVILFMIFVSLYIVLGIIHSSLTRGAHGWELIPHYEFWSDFPLLVRDGCVFVVSGCKADTAYERI